MDSPSPTATPLAPCSTPSSNEENPRVKFLCSFSGSILPRPQDGKLRYVGGETRIVSVPRDIMYEDLVGRMKELYEDAAVLKYQQPDEDLDALVSVVNDDDVMNMMEEYDKGDGFTRLRIFLFSQPDQDVSAHFGVDGDEKNTEKRYVDALNNVNDFESPVMRDEVHISDHFQSMNLEGSLYNQRNLDISLPNQYNLHRLNIPQMGSGRNQPFPPQRYNEMEAPWSPAYYSPRHHGHHDPPRPSAEFPSSPSSARYHVPFNGDLPDQPVYDHQPNQQQFTENIVWLPNGTITSDKSGFPGNILQGPSNAAFEGNSICEHCRMTFHRNPPQMEQPNIGGYQQVAGLCAECPPNIDPNIHYGAYPKEQTGPRTLYNEIHNHERGWVPPHHHHLNHQVEEPRAHNPGSGRLNDHYLVDGAGMNSSFRHANVLDGHQISSNYVHHDDPVYRRAAPEVLNEVFHDQAATSGLNVRVPIIEERPVRFGNVPYVYGADNFYQGSHGHNIPVHGSWRNVQHPLPGAPSYDLPVPAQQANSTINSGYFRGGTMEGSPRLCIGAENSNQWVESSPKMVYYNGSLIPEYSYGHALRLNQNTLIQENQHVAAPGPCQSSPDLVSLATPIETITFPGPTSIKIDDIVACSNILPSNVEQKNNTDVSCEVKVEENANFGEEQVPNDIEKVEISDIQSIPWLEQAKKANNQRDVETVEYVKAGEESVEEDVLAPYEHEKLSTKHLSVLPKLIASVERAAALDDAKEVKTTVIENFDSTLLHGSTAKEANPNDLGSLGAHGDSEVGSDSDNINLSIIEPTKAEAEAISRGLQTIKNDDLEESRLLGTGTYGAVYHGKWKGSDVAIKRIKSTCFSGRPSERERLISDFWKEALILSSLHHPNVVSFYGIVRDGPDGSLATVTEFMTNGSLKQYLQKKDRTIDRRKRLIIAMDAAFGMEYLHGKNIVHFDLKCENLLVNMRDPHRPVCKIGDLGLSKVKQHTLVSGGVRGTLPWMAPELLSGKSNMVTEKIDVYSFGIVMWELLTGDEPYSDMHCASIIGGIVNNMLRPQIPTWCDPEWKSLMETCWASEPAERPSFSDISHKLRNMAAAMNLK